MKEKSNSEKLNDVLLGGRILTDRMTNNTLEIIKLRKEVQEINKKLKKE